MSFKKLLPPIKNALQSLKIDTPTSFQKLLIPKIKSGVDIIAIAKEGAGKTTTLIINTIQKLNGAAYEDVPRALIFVQNKEAALVLEEEFNKFTKYTDLRIFCAYEESTLQFQKDTIYTGVDIVIGTPKRLNKIYFQNGINLTALQLLLIEDADFLEGTSFHTEIHRIAESLNKCQFIVFSNNYNSKIEKLQDLFLEHAEVIEL
ncbi:MAG: DEAD/DEAH box helicase [Flavobacteriales bacterium]|nr:DEAD/DEAH box helicase [Flavobacteriales bacterium]MCW8913782.1 DEAD/DEAH box helicase [Flavobacteriales bacterium]MCW8938877.1 DEAD/DEAH box helicase [Flavobacteriales bacterium]MCW8941272.1 DEAD/DEAH box helicase [Flavobacteriales bacterium]MCW8969119.1 DEAD/DEAH box helicase [Flavobacteriales bacterium]